ncbi:MAG TPA: alpha-amylase family glycosyl hydrolase [Terriglobales bacterium]|nr:alpha-amylase family glycosyl hydrolase [Terriglobales bacterium]
MPGWLQHPTLYEINTWVWLAELGKKAGSSVDLGSMPAAEWDAIAEFGFDAVWLMGVWQRSPAGIAVANRNENLLTDFRRALPDLQLEDNVGSPYCIRGYVVDQHLGGREGLATARAELAKRNMRLILDFVPNHVAPDHPWAVEHPEYFIQGTPEDLHNDPASFVQVGRSVFACGKDPYFPAWPDVLQLNAFEPGLRTAVVETLSDIAGQCDGVRCDMAMLLLNSVFERTWSARAGTKPETEYWSDVIPAIKQVHPEFRFIAEAYWDLEWELQQKGFDFCYDKRLYDRLEHENAESVRLHLCADLPYQEKLLRFIENHDEPRAAATFSPAKERAAALVTSTLPGARMFHEGQFEGRKTRLPVFLGRRPQEPADVEPQEFYRKLLTAINSQVFREGQWRLCERTGWPDNASFENIVAWSWSRQGEFYLVVVNLGNSTSQAQVKFAYDDLRGHHCKLTDLLSGSVYERHGDEMFAPGLYVDLAAWNFHFFRCDLSD